MVRIVHSKLFIPLLQLFFLTLHDIVLLRSRVTSSDKLGRFFRIYKQVGLGLGLAT